MRRGAISALCCGLLVLAAGCGGDAVPAIHHAPARYTTEWPEPNADSANTRFVGGPIRRTSVDRLEPAWTLRVGGYSATPIVVGGVVYLQDLNSTVYAVDLRSGAVRWKHAFADEGVIGPNGVTVGEGRVYGATKRRVFALNARTGKHLWSTRIAFRPGEGTDMAPGLHGGVVYVSTVPVTTDLVYQPGARGVLWALDAATGRKRWTWNTVPPGLWGHPERNSGGGLWHTPSFGGGGVYASIANPAPFGAPDEAAWGKTRPGPNKWTNAIVKLDIDTGKLIWGRQVLPHDVFDWDLECPVILRRVREREIAVVGGKMGIVYAFDRETGRPLWRRAVGKHNGHDHDNLKALRGELKDLPPDTRLLPGVYGGIETQMAADHEYVYAPVDNQYTIITGTQFLQNQDFNEATGEIVAIDLATGEVRWDRKLPHAVFGGATVVNGLVFTTTYDGTVWALRSDTGEVAWRERLRQGSLATVAVAGDTLLTAMAEGYGAESTVVAYRLARRTG